MGKHEFVWDGRGENGEDARLSIIAGRAATDARFTCVHFRVLAHLGRFNNKKGWCRISQTDLAELFGVTRRAINGALAQLVKWGYLARKSQQETGESFCQYRTILDQGGVSTDVLTPPSSGVSSAVLTTEKPSDTPVRTHKDTLNIHVEDIGKGDGKPAPPECEFKDGRIILRGAEYADHLARFDGDDRALTDALDQAALYIEPNSSKLILVQVRSQLSRISRMHRQHAPRRGSGGSKGSPPPAGGMSFKERARAVAERRQQALKSSSRTLCVQAAPNSESHLTVES